MAKDHVKKSSKADLIIAFQDLLNNNNIGTQEEICQALQKQGFNINQVKVSRILHKLGAIKMVEAGQTVYRMPSELMSVTPKDSVKNLVFSINHNESLVIIQTAPGSAQLVARLLDLMDQQKEIGILGTVAGDDTVFVAPVSVKQINKVYENIYKLLLN